MKKFIKLILVSLICILSINNVYARELLKRGSTGSDVKKLQEQLNKVMNCNLETDGIYGSKTYSCVVKFQDANNLTTDGIVGNKTYKKLYSTSNNNKKSTTINYSTNPNADLNNATKNNALVVTNKTIIRSEANEKSRALKPATSGEIYTYDDATSTGWYLVKISNDTYGYIKKSSISTNFVLVDISKQRLIYYRNNKANLNTRVVTGLKGVHDTPTGVYHLLWKTTDYHMKKYNADVAYWMPFTESGIGFHDASWRSTSQFKSSTYITSGSHGCVNMMRKDAKKLYKTLDKTTTIIVRK